MGECVRVEVGCDGGGESRLGLEERCRHPRLVHVLREPLVLNLTDRRRFERVDDVEEEIIVGQRVVGATGAAGGCICCEQLIRDRSARPHVPHRSGDKGVEWTVLVAVLEHQLGDWFASDAGFEEETERAHAWQLQWTRRQTLSTVTQNPATREQTEGEHRGTVSDGLIKVGVT